jgi:hypothetical protein
MLSIQLIYVKIQFYVFYVCYCIHMSEAKQFLVAGCWGNLNDVGNLKNVLLTLHENIHRRKSNKKY